jgi:uncharacterized protein (TIGR02453 family)
VKPVFQFLEQLEKNNHKVWFDEHRPIYAAAKAEMTQWVQTIIDELGAFDPSIAQLQAKDCLFRINRDVRFSKDKSPYKTNMGAYLNRAGKKSQLAGYYIHCEPKKCFLAGGVWMPEAASLKKIRQEIDYNFKSFTGILTKPAFKKNFADLDRSAEMSLVNIPRGYEKDNPAADYLKLKSFVATKPLTEIEICSIDSTKKVAQTLSHLLPLVNFLNEALLD